MRKISARWCAILVLVAGSMGGAARAAEWVALGSFQLWSSTYGDDSIRVVPVGASIVNPSRCADPDSYFVPAGLSKEAKQRTYATLLAGKAAGKPVWVWIDGCERDRPALKSARID